MARAERHLRVLGPERGRQGWGASSTEVETPALEVAAVVRLTRLPKEDSTMPMTASFIPEEERLDLCFEGSLDLRLATDICDICNHVSPSLQSCIVDLHGVERVFDSGVALLQMLCARLQRAGVLVLVLSEDPEVRRRIPIILATGDISQDHAPRGDRKSVV